MNKFLAVAISAIVLSALMFVANAAPMNGAEYSFRQPDGSLVPVRVWGDEFHQDVESPDGYTLIRGSDGWIYYAELSADGNEYVPTRVRYTSTRSRAPEVRRGLRINDESVMEKQHRARVESGYYEHIESRRLSRSSHPSNRSTSLQSNDIRHAPQEPERIVGLAILVDFNDTKTNFTREMVSERLNNPGGLSGDVEPGSVYDYFYNVSNGRLEYTHIVTSFITLDQNKGYYDTDTASRRWSEFINDIMEKLDEQVETGLVDLSEVTIENNTIVATSILYAGSPEYGWQKGLWPSASRINYTIGDISFGRAQMTNLDYGENTSSFISTVAHESGHMIMGWPDLYPYVGTTNHVGLWCIMSKSSLQRPNPYFLWLAGWIDTIDITNVPVGTLYSHTANSPLAYVYIRDEMDDPYTTNKELYMIEARRRTNPNEDAYNSVVPEDGLQVWHIHTGGNNSHTNGYPYVTHRGTFAANLLSREEFHRNRDSLSARYHKDTTYSTYSNDATYAGVFSNINIAEISSAGETMTFKIGDNLTDTTTPHYIITGNYPEFTVTKNGNQFFIPNQFTESVFTTIINAIRANAAGRECIIQFGDGNDTLDLGQETIAFTNMRDRYGPTIFGFSNITLSGKIISSNPDATITLNDEIFVVNEADIINTSVNSNGRAFLLFSFSGRLTIRNGDIVAANNLHNGGIIAASRSNGTIELLGGTITNTVLGGNAIYNGPTNSDVSLIFDETPEINGLISGFAAGKVSVSENFKPGGRKYILNPLGDARSDSALVVVGGGECFNNFELNSREFALATNGNDIVLERVPNYVTPTYYIVSGNTKIIGDGPVYNFTGFDANIRETVSVPPSGITVQINNPDYLHGAMLTVRNKGINDSVIVEWFGVMDQSSTNNIDRIAQLFGNGAQINNIATPWLNGIVSFDLRSATNETYLVDIEIYNWRNGNGYVASEDNDTVTTSDLFTARRRDNSIIGNPNQPIQSVVNAVGLYGGGEEFFLQFGNGNDFLDIDTANVLLGGFVWNNVTLLGKVTSASNVKTIELNVDVKNDAHIRNTSIGSAIFNSANVPLIINGGTMSATHAITNNSSSTTLGGSPTVNGNITWNSTRNLIIVTSGDNAFNPSNKKYVLNPMPIRDSMLVVTNGAAFLNNFELADTNYILVANGDDLFCYLVIPEDTVPIVENALIVTDAQSVTFTVDPIDITVGPNPTSRSTGVANIFLEGKKIRNAELSVYDASGSFVNRIHISDNDGSDNAKRQVGRWDLTDFNGRLVPGGSYIIRGTVIANNGENKNISVVIGVN